MVELGVSQEVFGGTGAEEGGAVGWGRVSAMGRVALQVTEPSVVIEKDVIESEELGGRRGAWHLWVWLLKDHQ